MGYVLFSMKSSSWAINSMIFDAFTLVTMQKSIFVKTIMLPEKEDPYSVTELALNRKNAVIELNNNVWNVKTRQFFQFNNDFEGDGRDGDKCAVWMPVIRYIFWMFWNSCSLPAMMTVADELNWSTILSTWFIWRRDMHFWWYGSWIDYQLFTAKTERNWCSAQ